MTNAYVLHRRPFKESSLLVEFFTEEKGRVSCLAKGAKKQKSVFRGFLEPFIPLKVELSGKSDLKYLTACDLIDVSPRLCTQKLAVGFYLNEILLRALGKSQPVPVLFDAYHHSMLSLITPEVSLDLILREFEFIFLQEMGLGFSLDNIQSEETYWYLEEIGLVPHLKGIKGEYLLALKNREALSIDAKRALKKLFQVALRPCIGEKPLQSRRLWQSQTHSSIVRTK